MNIIKKIYYYGYSLYNITYIYLLRLIYKNYNENRKAIKNNNYIDNIYALFGDCNYIIDNIYLGSCFNASNKSLLDELNIKKIVNISYDIPNYYEDIEYYNYKIKDDGKDILEIEKLKEILTFVLKDKQNILIHCVMGRSRSVSFIIYYLMIIHNMNIDDAIKYIEKKRYVINPSVKFYNNLKNLK